MVEHYLLFSRYIGNHGHLWPRDFKQANECFYPSISLLPTTAVTNREYLNSAATTRFYKQRMPQLKLVGEIKVHTQIYFFILKLKPQNNISKTVKIKGCEHPAAKFLARASVPKETQAFTRITLHQFCRKQRVIQDTAYGLNLILYKI